MAQKLKTILVLTVCMLTFMTASAIEKPGKIISGVFGVCDCQSKNAKSQIIELTLNEDLTFTYVDNSDPSNKLSLTGKWTAKGNKFYLTASDNRKSFHRKWKYEKSGQCIKSRYQLNFRRICLMKPC